MEKVKILELIIWSVISFVYGWGAASLIDTFIPNTFWIVECLALTIFLSLLLSFGFISAKKGIFGDLIGK